MTTDRMSPGSQPLRRRGVDALWQVPVAAALVAIAAVSVGIRPELVGFLYLALVSSELCRTDVTQRRLPNALVVPGYFATVIGLAFGWLRTGVPPVTAVLAGAGAFAFLLLLSAGGGMGMGDVKLGGLLGLNLGVLGVAAAVAGPTIAFVIGGLAGVVALILPASGTRIPFGPYLLIGFWAASALPMFGIG
ncbi:prepilin peptidase [Rathayibacter soli]|uniref:prepilin peptidase n=1 Tax=Rathayibacter soli TaxID=3144168 RepID=UPI0027E51190|nr:prepilin peptidase [Glaciibacter superstes]